MLRTNGFLSLIGFFFLIVINPSLSRADEKSTAVNQQLDMFDTPSNTANGVDRQFSNPRPESPSAGSLLKDIFNPDTLQKPERRTPQSSNVTTRVNTVDAGAEVFYYRYQEPSFLATNGSTTPDIKIQGPMYGYYANYAYRPADPNFFNNFLTNVYFLQARYASSRELEYSGDGIIKNKHDEDMEFRGLIGKDYRLGTNVMLTPYFGFGYRYLIDHGNGLVSSIGGTDYDRKSHYYYLPLGGDVVINMPNNWEIDPNIEYDIFIQGYQKSFLSDADMGMFNNPDIVNHQTTGFGIRGSVKFLKKGTWVDFYMEPYIRYWNIEQSKLEAATVDGVFSSTWNEPANNTIEVGSKFGVEF